MRNRVKGHPFYFTILKTLEKVSEKKCSSMEDIISTPIWFKKNLRTSFDSEISLAGFNFIKDLFPQNQPLENFNGLRSLKIRKLRNIVNRIPPSWRDMIDQSGCRQ